MHHADKQHSTLKHYAVLRGLDKTHEAADLGTPVHRRLAELGDVDLLVPVVLLVEQLIRLLVCIVLCKHTVHTRLGKALVNR